MRRCLILRRAHRVRLCGADRAFIFRFDGELLRMAVAYNASPDFAEWVEKHPIRPGRQLKFQRLT